MADFSLGIDSWDLRFVGGDIAIVDGVEETSQNSRFRLQILRGEVFEDNRIGVPWLTDMADPRVSIDAKKQILRSTILRAPRALTLDSLEIQVDDSSGLAEVVFSGTAEGGGIFGGVVGSADPLRGLSNPELWFLESRLSYIVNNTIPAGWS